MYCYDSNQIQMMQYMRVAATSQGLYMPPFQGPHLPAYFTMRPMIGVDYSMRPYGSYFTSNFPVLPSFSTGFPSLPPTEMAIRSSSVPPIQHPSQTFEPMYSTTLSSDTIINPAIGLQNRYEISSQSTHHIPVTSQVIMPLLVHVPFATPSFYNVLRHHRCKFKRGKHTYTEIVLLMEAQIHNRDIQMIDDQEC
ncbi:hypothetical protein OSB04_021955 [Centaurea solstitialis]|uniref:Uncharacterized protein n=1 Tax=Centaurea solstitialis TaxID=347529 RepID=A0AA38W5F5_9ASTR|nr:hypothetical protein OSB04_021955 [Centaurea solstitialis]